MSESRGSLPTPKAGHSPQEGVMGQPGNRSPPGTGSPLLEPSGRSEWSDTEVWKWEPCRPCLCSWCFLLRRSGLCFPRAPPGWELEAGRVPLRVSFIEQWGGEALCPLTDLSSVTMGYSVSVTKCLVMTRVQLSAANFPSGPALFTENDFRHLQLSELKCERKNEARIENKGWHFTWSATCWIILSHGHAGNFWFCKAKWQCYPQA